MTLKLEDLPEGSRQALLKGLPVTAASPWLQAELDRLKVEVAERKAAQVAKPVYAIDRAATLAQQTKATRALKVLYGEGLHWVEHGPRLIYFTPGELCDCRACDGFMRRIADLSYIEYPSIMVVCSRCGDKRCPQAANHEDPCRHEMADGDAWLYGHEQ